MAYAGRIYPGISIFSQDVSGFTPQQASSATETLLQKTFEHGISIQGINESTDTQISLWDKKTPRPIEYELDTAIDRAMRLGRQGNTFQRVITQGLLRIKGYRITPVANIDTQQLEEILKNHVAPYEHAGKNADVRLIQQGNALHWEIVMAENGHRYRFDEAIGAIRQMAETLSVTPIRISREEWSPSIDTSIAERAITNADPRWLNPNNPRIALKQDTATLSIASTQDIQTWIGLVASTSSSSGWTIGIDPERFATDLVGRIPKLNQQPKNGFLVVKDGRAETFTAPEDGTSFDATSTALALENAWLLSQQSAPIKTHAIPARIEGADAAFLGIQEIIGVGTSTFGGSPQNRRKNIQLGAKKVHGTIVQPGEEFSMMKTLGAIDGEHGWLPELVIKDNKTTPEFGGGLCQVGTTAFRAAMQSGLPITERRNHAYRVVYYEPAGTDATIYDPSPDLKFKNDMTQAILLTTRVVGDQLIFTFWGTKDGRRVDPLVPQISRIVPPPAKQEIPTTELPPGTVKCTEVAHAGADATLDYTVTYPNQEIKKTVFRSHYKPWGAVCLIGVSSDQHP